MVVPGGASMKHLWYGDLQRVVMARSAAELEDIWTRQAFLRHHPHISHQVGSRARVVFPVHPVILKTSTATDFPICVLQ